MFFSYRLLVYCSLIPTNQGAIWLAKTQISLIFNYCLGRNQRFFATLLMTASYGIGGGEGVGSGSATSNPLTLIYPNNCHSERNEV
jgi:hypothetical protein